MKKVILIIGAALLVLALSACSSHYRIFINERAEADKIAQQVVTAIENKDEQALLELFSEQALSDAADLNEGMSYTFDLFQGECQEIEDGFLITNDHFERNNRIKQIHAKYKITTTEGVYWLYFDFTFIDEANPETEGIYTIWFYDDKGKEAMNNNEGLSYRAGIYHPGWDTEPIKKQSRPSEETPF
jgi:hypothetical protein